ncbi:hypothetical protein [Marinobacter sp.]|uniref:hypothetical protein n=1 Tax=Marinobacter sp. TaxID=50741 RepID=UPI003A90BAFB
MDESEIQKMFFHPVCTRDEIERIFNVQNAKDYLLKLRAETIVDNTRLFRVYRRKALASGDSWTLEKSFNDAHWQSVIGKLPEDQRAQCKNVTFGDILSTDPNGMIFETEYGPVATICNSMEFFTKFANLAFLGFKTEVPYHVRINALKISIRVMLKTEAMDFSVDPRGVLPADVANEIARPIPWLKKFIAGHEIAHYILGHLTNENVIEQPVLCATSIDDDNYKPSKVFNPSQKNEFEADLQSILMPKYNDIERGEVLTGALLWLAALDVFEHVSDMVCPKAPHRYQTHPSPSERYENLLTSIPAPQGMPMDDWRQLSENIKYLKEYLTEDVGFNIENYEFYGSIYLDKPNSAWRGRELIDRVDY